MRGRLIAVASCCGVQASVVVARGLNSCGSRAPERRLSSCGTRAQPLRGMWDPSGPGLEPVSPALAGRFLTTCLLYTSDAADEGLGVDLGGRRIIKKK